MYIHLSTPISGSYILLMVSVKGGGGVYIRASGTHATKMYEEPLCSYRASGTYVSSGKQDTVTEVDVLSFALKQAYLSDVWCTC